MSITAVLAAVFSAVLGAMGMGGGGLLILYLGLFTDLPQHTAQGINLLLFLPCALIATLYYTKKDLISYKEIFSFTWRGVLGAIFGCVLSSSVNSFFLRKGFGIFLLIIGLREIVGCFRKKANLQ